MGRPGYPEFRSVIKLPLGYRILFRILFPLFGWRSLPLSVFLPSLLFSVFVVFLVFSLVSRFVDRPSDSLSSPVLSSFTAVPTPVALTAVVPTPVVLSTTVSAPLPGHCTVWCYPGTDCVSLALLNPKCNVVIVEGEK